MIGDEFVRHKWSSRLAPLVIQYVNARLLIISEKCSSINVNIHWTTIFHKISTGQQYFLSEVQVRSRLLASGPFWILLFIRLRVFGTQQSNATTRLACLNWNSFVFVYLKFKFWILYFCICVFVIVYLHSSMYLWSCTCSSRPSVWPACLLGRSSAALARGYIPMSGTGSFNQHLAPCFTNSLCHFQSAGQTEDL